MFAEERKQRILEYLSMGHSVKVANLRSLLSASDASIRRDLKALQSAGLLKRTHGGAVAGNTAAFEPSAAEKEDQFRMEKMAIASAAVRLVQDGDTIMLDAGSTTLQLARLLKNRRNITVVTNAINVAQELATGQAEVTLIGGSFRRLTLSLVGPIAESALSGLYVDKLFLATNGLDLEKGLTTPNLLESQVKRAMVESAREIILLTDHSKFGRVTFSQICPLNRIHCVITNAAAPADFVAALQSRGLKVLIAD
jgi:DeoR family transcriptional regulator, fructose operon transcriptional repressor